MKKVKNYKPIKKPTGSSLSVYSDHKYRHKECDSNNRYREAIYLSTGSHHYEHFTLLRKKMRNDSIQQFKNEKSINKN